MNSLPLREDCNTFY